jgi:DNA polymerase III subunit delta'
MWKLSDIVGQDGAVERLRAALDGSRRPHALLFAGPRGVGRRTTALAYAAALLCGREQGPALPGLDPPPREACGECEDCRALEAGTHPDFHLVYKEMARYHEDSQIRGRVMQELGIPVIRRFLLDIADRAPSRGRGKVFIVLEAELMSIAAQNCLLKTLEEPPRGVTIVLVCRQAERMLPTTLSRCSMVRFGFLPGEFVSSRLAEEGVEAQEAKFWSAYTGGSIGRAMELSRRGFYAVKRDVLDRLASLGPMGDVELGEHLVKLTDRFADSAVAESKKQDGNLAKSLASRQAAGAMLELIAGAYRDAMRVATGADLPIVHADQAQAIDAMAQAHEPATLGEIIEQLSEYERLLWRNVNAKYVWDNVVLTCARGGRLRLEV